MSFANLSEWLRSDILVPSGGWIADVVPLISDALAIWDIFILSTLFIISWVVLRVSDSLTSLILGFAFDVTIPLQHYLNENIKEEHQAHLDGYWPILGITTGLELMCFFLVHPDLFTLVVCLKTTGMTAIWLGRKSDGTYITAAKGSKSGSGTGTGRAGGRGGNPSETKEERWDRKLKEAGYDDPEGRKGMIEYLKGLSDPRKQEETLRTWTSERDPEKRKARMNKYKKGTGDPARGSKDRAKDYDDRLTKAGYKDPKARKKLGESLTGMEPEVAERKLKEWENDSPEGKKAREQKVLGKSGRSPPAAAGARQPAGGVTPANMDPMDFRDDLMDIAAPPGLGPPIDPLAASAPPPGSRERDDVTGADLQPILPTAVGGAPRPQFTPVNPNSGDRASINSGYSSDGGRSDTGSSASTKSGGLRKWFKDRKEKRRAKKEAERLTPPIPPPPADPIMRMAPILDVNGRPIPSGPHHVDPGDAAWKSDIPDYKNKEETGVWERALDQDSIELLIHYLKNNGRVTPEIAGWMIMDLMSELNPLKVKNTVEDWRNALNDEEWDMVLEPYKERSVTRSGWVPGNAFWYQGGIDDRGQKQPGSLDHLLWNLRKHGIHSAARNAIVRDLMSTPRSDKRAYERKYNEIFARGTGQVNGGFDSQADQARERKALVMEYQNKRQFGPHMMISEMEAHERSEKLKRRGYGLDMRSKALNDLRALPLDQVPELV